MRRSLIWYGVSSLELLQRSECSFVVRLLRDLGDELGVEDLACLIDDDDGTRQETSQRTILLLEAIVLREAVVAEDRYGYYLVEAFSTAEARLSERQVLRYTEDDGVVELRSFGIEATYAGSADACVDAGEDVEHDTLTTQILEVDLAEVRLRSPEVRSGSAYGRHFTREVYGEVFFESDCCHCLLYCFCLLARKVGGG